MTASEIQTIPESAAEGSDPMLLMTITGRVQFQFPSTNLLFAEKKRSVASLPASGFVLE